MMIMKYVLMERTTALGKGIIQEDTVCRTDGVRVLVTEDEAKKGGNPEELGEVLTAKAALKLLEQRSWKF